MSGRPTKIEPTIVPFRGLSLDNGGGPPDPPDVMSIRVAHLESDVKDLRSDMKQVVRDLGFLKGKVGALPSTWTMVTTVVGANIALLGLVFTLLKLIGGH